MAQQGNASQGSLLPYRARKPMTGDLVALARQLETAHDYTRANVGSRLGVIVDQMRSLQAQAHRVMSEAARDTELHNATCKVLKVPGHVYHLYQRESGEKYLAVLSPEEWGGSPPHPHLGSYRLEADQSWTPLAEVSRRDRDMGVVRDLARSLGDTHMEGDTMLALLPKEPPAAL